LDYYPCTARPRRISNQLTHFVAARSTLRVNVYHRGDFLSHKALFTTTNCHASPFIDTRSTLNTYIFSHLAMRVFHHALITEDRSDYATKNAWKPRRTHFAPTSCSRSSQFDGRTSPSLSTLLLHSTPEGVLCYLYNHFTWSFARSTRDWAQF
jgi:hypothetical protein